MFYHSSGHRCVANYQFRDRENALCGDPVFHYQRVNVHVNVVRLGLVVLVRANMSFMTPIRRVLFVRTMNVSNLVSSHVRVMKVIMATIYVVNARRVSIFDRYHVDNNLVSRHIIHRRLRGHIPSDGTHFFVIG